MKSNKEFSFDYDQNYIIIDQKNYNCFRKYMDWAHEHPELYHVFSSGVIKGKTSYSIEWFMLKWM